MHALSYVSALSLKWKSLFLLVGILGGGLVGFLGYANVAPISNVNNLLYDALQELSATGNASANTVVVDIDEVSLDALGQWPWPRYRVAELVQQIAAAQPAAIGLDIIFAEPDRTALVNITKAFKQDFGLDIEVAGVPAALTDNDGYLGSVLSDSGAVGATYFYFDHRSKIEIARKPPFDIVVEPGILKLHEAPGMLDNTFRIASQLRYSGFLNNLPDEDGLLRRLPLLITHNGVIYPHLSLAAFMRAVGETRAAVVQDGHGPEIHVGEHIIPISESGYVRLRFNGPPHLYETLSALDMINGSFDPQALRGKVVFIGSSAAGLKDLYHTVFDAQFPGVKTHAVMVENIFDGRVTIEPYWGGSAAYLLCMVTGILLSLLFMFVHKPVLELVGTNLWIVTTLLGGWALFEQGLFLAGGGPVVTALFLYTLFIILRFAIERQHAYTWFRQLANARQVTMESMAAVAESRDPETGAHIKRTQHYVRAIAEALVNTGYYRRILSRDYIDLLFVSAPLHDIGKVGVPDKILMKPDKLSDEEFELMKMHAEYGKRIIYSTAEKIEGNNFLILAGEIAATHHEKWDGSGYPNGLAGEGIPLSGRIMAVADVYDALISRRCYKEPFSHEKACSILQEGRGTSFDPIVLEAFFRIEEQIRKIASRYVDAQEIVLGDR